MAWDKSFINMGVTKFDDQYVYVYYNEHGGYTSMYFSDKITSAHWAGDSVVVTTVKGTYKCYGQHQNERTSF